MRILLLCLSLPFPAHQGGALRVLGMLRGLADAGHAVTLLSFDDPPAPDSPLHALCERIVAVPLPQRTRQARALHLLTSPQPDIVHRMRSSAMEQALRELLAHPFDLVQFAGLEMATYLPSARPWAGSAKLIYDAFNAEYALQRTIADVEDRSLRRLPAALYSRIQARRIYTFERSICQQADGVIAVSPEDQALLQPFRDDDRVRVLPSGVFAAEYAAAHDPGVQDAHMLVFTGKMDYRPNVDACLWFAREALPLIVRSVPDVRWRIVGQKPHPDIAALHNPPQIDVTGWVPDVKPYLRGAAVYIAPLRMGSGTRLKLLEAMASGCAIVATPLAAAGLEDEAKRAQRSAADAPAFAAQVVDLLQNPHAGAQLGAAARAAVARVYDWSALMPRLFKIYEDFGLG